MPGPACRGCEVVRRRRLWGNRVADLANRHDLTSDYAKICGNNDSPIAARAHLGDRVAAGRLHRDDAATSLTGTNSPATSRASSLTALANNAERGRRRGSLDVRGSTAFADV